MKVLLDNCVPRAFERDLPGHEVTHCRRLGWERLANGNLLAAAEAAGFPVMVTVDRNLQFQQNMIGREIAVICLRTPNNSIDTLRDMAGEVANILPRLEPGTVVTLSHPAMR